VLSSEKYNFEDLNSFIIEFQKQLSLPLPGRDAQLKMASAMRNRELGFSYDTSTATKSSVLISFYPDKGKLITVFILRQTYDGVHSGQVSFPGGRMEPEDISLVQTALREAQEEVNIDSGKVKIIGTLSELFIPPSNFIVLPVIGFLEERPDLKPDISEVSEIIEADLSFLFDDSRIKQKTIEINGHKIEAPYFDVHGKVIWGATAMILSELKEVILSVQTSLQ
jgi:8-oxo-dGTP pyrophosphatase MutT (NUDIX family)